MKLGASSPRRMAISCLLLSRELGPRFFVVQRCYTRSPAAATGPSGQLPTMSGRAGRLRPTQPGPRLTDPLGGVGRPRGRRSGQRRVLQVEVLVDGDGRHQVV